MYSYLESAIFVGFLFDQFFNGIPTAIVDPIVIIAITITGYPQIIRQTPTQVLIAVNSTIFVIIVFLDKQSGCFNIKPANAFPLFKIGSQIINNIFTIVINPLGIIFRIFAYNSNHLGIFSSGSIFYHISNFIEYGRIISLLQDFLCHIVGDINYIIIAILALINRTQIRFENPILVIILIALYKSCLVVGVFNTIGIVGASPIGSGSLQLIFLAIHNTGNFSGIAAIGIFDHLSSAKSIGHPVFIKICYLFLEISGKIDDNGIRAFDFC